MEHSSSFYTKLYGIPWERHSIFSVRVQTTHRPSGSRDTGKPASLASVAIPQQSRQESYGRFGRVQPFLLINDCLILYRQLNGNLVLVLVFIYYKHNSGLWSNSQMRFQFNYWEPFRRFDGVVLKCLWTCWPSQLCFRAVRQDRHRRLKVSVLPFASRCPVESVSQSVYREVRLRQTLYVIHKCLWHICVCKYKRYVAAAGEHDLFVIADNNNY